ncbi:alpha/beta-hydrolase [Mycena albidolilacea]|uniref:Carboxylic ester hydrolase n=1 Tax=Mycena albidolilacea TaxID=1033008 RepID=A0AAD6ZKF4_9AGAR|nr:alpha/beta-hydrolase [Mycena albidolilacea]
MLNCGLKLLTATLFYSSALAKPFSSFVDRTTTAEPRGLSGTLTSKLGPVVNLGYAAYAGNSTLPDVTFYGGIPYTKPPVGNLRFAPPQQLDESHKILSNDDVVDARNWGPLCIQQPAVMGIGSEDCVTLNIWTPSNATSKSKLPVYVYIHGGGHYYNSAQGFPANDWVARSNGGLIAVALQYRLGLLGYLSGSAIRANPTSGPNNGLLDQRAALEWIQRNIAAFGGDATKVTIGGESSGGGSVTLHLTAFGGEKNPPFRAAVIESSGNDPFYTTDHTELCFGNVTKQVGCDGASDVVACLRKASTGAIVSAVNNKPSTCKYEPVIDGNYIPDITTKLLAAGKFTKVPILAGHNAQDGSIFVGTPASIVTDADIITAILKRYPGLPTTLTDALLVTYPPASSTTPWTTQWERAMYAYMESELACWDYYIGNISGKPAFNYRWDAPDPNLVAARGAYVGAAHTAELFYLYDGTNSGPSASVAQPVFSVFTAPQDALARQAVAWWSSFARTLDPNTFAAPGSPKWAPASAGGFMVAALSNDTASSVPSSGMAPRTDDYPKRCAWWRSVGTDLRL